jgi:signal transduction histidine kinase
VRLQRTDGLLALLVEDNGVGFDPAQVTGRREDGRLGILGMQERAALIGGDLRIESQPGRGTRVLLTVPVGEAG